ncbi:MAG: E3 binding domain-containing protein, partial [Deinococcales bacterium]
AQTRAEGSWERPGGDGPPGAPGVGAAGSERATAQGAVARNGSGARPGAAAAGAGPAAAVAGRVPASPKARRLAGEHGIDLASLRGAGSGPEGAILAADVLRAVERRPQTSAATATTSTAPAAWTTFQRELDAAPLLQALARTRGARKGADGAPAIDVGDLLARFLGAVWSRHPLAGGEQDSVRMRYRRLADGRLQAALIEDAGRASVLGIAAARETAEPVGAGREGAGTAGDATELSLLDLTRARVDLGGDAATPGALVSVVAGRLDERVVAANGAPELRTTFTLRLAFDPTHVELASAAAWADRVIELAEDPSALALLY